MTEKELDEMIAEANCDKDGHIDYEGEINVLNVLKCNKTISNFEKSMGYFLGQFYLAM